MAVWGSPARHGPRTRPPGSETAFPPLRRARAISEGRETAFYIVSMEDTRSLDTVPDDELLRRLAELLRHSRRVEADLVAHIGEVDARRLYAREASPSMFAYCTQALHLSEFEAYLRITVARAARLHPVLLEKLREGSLHLSAVAKLAPHLTPENRGTLLARAAHRSKREVEELIAEIAPRPDTLTVIRKLPDRGGTFDSDAQLGPDRVEPPGLHHANDPAGEVLAGTARVERLATEPLIETPQQLPNAAGDFASVAAARPRPARVEPLSPARYKVEFTAGAGLRDKLERLKALMRSSVPDGDLAALIELAVTEKLERLEAKRFGRTKAPRKNPVEREASPCSRHVPAAVRRAVYERDEGRCRFVDQQGRRCTARDGLEFHHRRPFGHGGEHSLANISLQCRRHNNSLAEVDYGREAMKRHIRESASALRSLDPGRSRRGSRDRRGWSSGAGAPGQEDATRPAAVAEDRGGTPPPAR